MAQPCHTKECILKCTDAARYYDFPDEDIFRNLWLYQLGLQRLDEPASVCDKHFSEKMLLSSGKELVELAIPDHNLPKSTLNKNVIYEQLIKKLGRTSSPEREIPPAPATKTVNTEPNSTENAELKSDTSPTANSSSENIASDESRPVPALPNPTEGNPETTWDVVEDPVTSTVILPLGTIIKKHTTRTAAASANVSEALTSSAVSNTQDTLSTSFVPTITLPMSLLPKADDSSTNIPPISAIGYSTIDPLTNRPVTIYQVSMPNLSGTLIVPGKMPTDAATSADTVPPATAEIPAKTTTTVIVPPVIIPPVTNQDPEPLSLPSTCCPPIIAPAPIPSAPAPTLPTTNPLITTNTPSNSIGHNWLGDTSSLLMDYQLRIEGKNVCDVIELPEYIVVFTHYRAKQLNPASRNNMRSKENLDPLALPPPIDSALSTFSKEHLTSCEVIEIDDDSDIDDNAPTTLVQPEIDYVYYMTEEANPRREREIQVDIGNETAETAIQCDVELDTDIMQMTHGVLVRKEKSQLTTSVKKHECLICGEIVGNLASIKKHADEHRKIQALCSQCGQVFSNYKKLKTHEKDVHSQSEPEIKKALRCPKLHCKKAFHSKKQLSNHVDQHLGKIEHKCNKCLRLFHSALKLHCHQSVFKNCLKQRKKPRRWSRRFRDNIQLCK